jgi:hypothetical protein
MLPYVEKGQLVDIGGRRINLHCTGAGSPTVILMDGVDHNRLGAMPLRVLSIENAWSNGTPAGARFNRTYSKVWTALHQDLARLSSRGVHRIITDSGHQIELDQPQAVIDAVYEVLREIHIRAKP